MKAWYSWDPDNEFANVYFAETRGKARWQAYKDIFNDYYDHFYEVPCKRFAAADGLTHAELTTRFYLDNGWWMPCEWCDDTVCDGDAYWDKENRLFCSRACLVKWHRDMRAKRQQRLLEGLLW